MDGRATTLVSRKNRTQPIFSDNAPPEEATTVRLSEASEDSSANCVAVKAGEVALAHCDWHEAEDGLRDALIMAAISRADDQPR